MNRLADAPRRNSLLRVARSTMGLAMACAGMPSFAGDRLRDGRTEPANLRDTVQWMRWVQGAMEQRSFQGTYVVTSGSGMSTSRIVHVCDGRNQFERIDALDGQTRQVFRHNETVHVFWPTNKEATVESRPSIRRFPLQSGAPEPATLDMYEWLDAGTDRVAGHETVVVTFKARDNLRYAQRWWVEKKTGLLLRADTFGPLGEVIESAAFSDIQLGTRTTAQSLLQEMNRLDGYRVRRPTTEPTDLEAEGWTLQAAVSGFKTVSSVRRVRGTGSAPPAEALNPTSGNPMPALPTTPLLQTIFSDGLTHVSVFIEPFALHPRRVDRQMSAGATQGITRRSTDWWITAVGDVPPETVALFTKALQRKPS